MKCLLFFLEKFSFSICCYGKLYLFYLDILGKYITWWMFIIMWMFAFSWNPVSADVIVDLKGNGLFRQEEKSTHTLITISVKLQWFYSSTYMQYYFWLISTFFCVFEDTKAQYETEFGKNLLNHRKFPRFLAQNSLLQCMHACSFIHIVNQCI